MKWSISVNSMLAILLYFQNFVESTYYSATLRRHPGSSDEWNIEIGHVESAVASASFSNQIRENGWSFLRVVTNEVYSDEEQAYGAGLLEGNLTCDLMKDRWANVFHEMCEGKDGRHFCNKLWEYLNNNKRWLKDQLETYFGTHSTWHQVGLTLKQLQGLQDGCQGSLVNDGDHKVLRDFTFLLFSLKQDTDDLRNALFNQKGQRPGSGSALIKWISGGNDGDLLVGHVTWNDYSDMIRILKNYEFYFHRTDAPDSPQIPGHNMTFSSYPGALHSGDDFYLISSGLATLKTTLSNDKRNLWDFVEGGEFIPEFMRSMAANRLATDCSLWINNFFWFSSNMYSNQWMIIDYKEFENFHKRNSNNLLWIYEQGPDWKYFEDETIVLQRQGYWPSYNVPYYSPVDRMSGPTQKVQKGGSIYEDNARAQIFRRNQSLVINLDTMYNLLRSNNYLNDPLSICNCTPTHNAMLALSARGDLNPVQGTYPLRELEHMPFGAIDLKITNYRLFQSLQFEAVSGPPYESESLTPFQWNTYENHNSISHVGQPNLWQFEHVLTTWE